MRRFNAAPIALVVLLVALPGASRAQEAQDVREEDMQADQGRVTTVNFGVDADGTGASGVFASIGVPIGANDTVGGALGRMEFDEVMRRNGDVVPAHPADRVALSYRHSFGEASLRFGAERWGNDDEVLIHDLSASLDYEAERTDWSLEVVRRSSTVTLERLPVGPDEVRVEAWGLTGDVTYLADALDLYLSLTLFDYGDDLDTGPIAAHLGDRSALSVADSLIERGVTMGGRHYFESWSLGLEAAWYGGGIAADETRTLAALFGLPLAERLDLTLTAGGVSSQDEGTAAFGVIALRCAFGGGS